MSPQDRPAPGRTGPPPAAPRRRRRVLVPLLMTIAVVAGFVGAGVDSFAEKGGFTPAPSIGTAVDCELGLCMPGLDRDDLLATMRDAGYVCTNEPLHKACTLEVGVSAFDLIVMSPPGSNQVHSLRASIPRGTDPSMGGLPPDAPPARATVPYLTWIATVPYAGDAQSTDQIATWIRRQVEAGADATVQFGDYRYEIAASDPTHVTLTVTAERPLDIPEELLT